jgi:hypothetical protein
VLVVRHLGLQAQQQFGFGGAGALLPPDAVDGAETAGRNQPAPGALRQAALWLSTPVGFQARWAE